MILTLFLCVMYFIFIILIITGISKIKSHKGNYKYDILPHIALIIAFRNEEANLPALFSDLKKIKYPEDKLEIILVDDHSEDQSKSLAVKFCAENKNSRLLQNKGHGKKEAVISGILESKHELIVKTDADCRLNNNWLLTLGSFQAEKKANMIIAPVILEESGSLLSKFFALEFLSLTGSAAALAMLGKPVMCNGANMAVTRDVFNNGENLMNTSYASGDDSFLLYNLKKDQNRSVAFVFSDDAIVATKAPETWQEFYQQRKRWVSKSAGVRDIDTIIIALIVLLINLALACMFVLGLFETKILLWAGVLYAVKSGLDFIFLFRTAKVFKRMHFMRLFLPVSLLYPFYVVLSVSGGLFGKFSWKKRIYRF